MNFSMIVYILAWVLRIEGISLLLPKHQNRLE